MCIHSKECPILSPSAAHPHVATNGAESITASAASSFPLRHVLVVITNSGRPLVSRDAPLIFLGAPRSSSPWWRGPLYPSRPQGPSPRRRRGRRGAAPLLMAALQAWAPVACVAQDLGHGLAA
ncbi:hypothetical protein LX36DRAFT_383278 [Colletotrichum falcatum]|nr:hypothetical protein LX36DRAFT_383278 [Colletotrichum falcatum]